jgi:tripartite-type tricarboxylate transporter receptor subunit TctC
MKRLGLSVSVAIAATLLVVRPGSATTAVADFYRGKTIRVIVGYPPPSTFDTYARLLTRHMPRYVPGSPGMIVQSMPGAGSLNATSYVAAAAPRDGTVLGAPNPVNTTEPLLSPERTRFDSRAFQWLGSMNSEISTCGFWNNSAATIDDFLTKELTVGATGPASGTTVDVRTLQNIFGYKFKVITGYQGLTQLSLASERGELDGHCGITVTTLKANLWEQFRKGVVKIPIQMGLTKHPDLPTVPNAFDLAEKEEDRQVLAFIFGPWLYGRGVTAPPGIPPERLAALREAFHATMRDPAFLIEAEKSGLEIQPLGPEKISAQIELIYKTPVPVIERIRKIVQAP